MSTVEEERGRGELMYLHEVEHARACYGGDGHGGRRRRGGLVRAEVSGGVAGDGSCGPCVGLFKHMKRRCTAVIERRWHFAHGKLRRRSTCLDFGRGSVEVCYFVPLGGGRFEEALLRSTCGDGGLTRDRLPQSL